MLKTLVVVVLLAVAGLARAQHPMLPKVGTVFVCTYYLTDSSGHLTHEDDPGLDNDTITVARTGFRIHGKSNVVELHGNTRHDTTYLAYAKNGNVFVRSVQDTIWTELQFSLPRGKVVKLTMPDEVVSAFNEQYTMFHLRDLQVVGHDTASIAGKIYDCIKYTMKETRVFEGKEYVNVFTYWYSPELGYWPRQNFGWGNKYFLNQQIIQWTPPSAKNP